MRVLAASRPRRPAGRSWQHPPPPDAPARRTGTTRPLRRRPRSRSPARGPSPRSTAASGTTWVTPAAAPAKTSPVAPSIVIVSPGLSTVAPMVTLPSPSTTPEAPTTAGIPQPRATTAAWLTNPPVLVRIPTARLIPWTSSGEVSERTRMTRRPASAAVTAASGVRTISPQATPGEAARPVVSAATGVGALGHGGRRVGEDLRDAPDRLLAGQRERRVLGHLEGHPQRRLRRPLADADLEHPEPALLDRELDVAAVPVVVLERRGVAPQLGRDVRHPLVEDPDVLGLVRARDHVLALGVEHDVAVEGVLAGRRVAREQHAGPGVRAAVAEHHRLDGHARAQGLADALVGAIGARAVAVPGAEHGLDGAAQLRPRVLPGPR